MTNNFFSAFKKIFPDAPLQVGTVLSVDGAIATVQLPSGGVMQVRGTADVGQQVWMRDGVVEGIAPTLPLVQIQV